MRVRARVDWFSGESGFGFGHYRNRKMYLHISDFENHERTVRAGSIMDCELVQDMGRPERIRGIDCKMIPGGKR
jgi:cold shock CspA family protein